MGTMLGVPTKRITVLGVYIRVPFLGKRPSMRMSHVNVPARLDFGIGPMCKNPCANNIHVQFLT